VQFSSPPPSPSKLTIPTKEKVYSIDVECVATGVQHNDRATAQIALVDGEAEVLLNLIVKPTAPVVSYLTPLTGLTEEIMEEKGISLEDAMIKLREALPKDAILVGQNILKDVEWLGLQRGVDFEGMLDLAAMLRCWNPAHNRY
jgi:RNA exonuclease 4